MTMGKGRRWENEVANDIYDESDGELLSWTAGYSGNGSVPAPDVLVGYDGGVDGYELKRTGQDTFYIPVSDLEQLVTLERSWLTVYLVVKFTNRESVFVRPRFHVGQYGRGVATDCDVLEQFAKQVPAAFTPTDGCMVDSDDGDKRSLRLDRPDLSEWRSARTGATVAEKVRALHGVGGFDSIRGSVERVRDLHEITHGPSTS